MSISDQIHRLVTEKFHDTMEQVVAAQNIIDESELKAFDTYTWRNKHMLDKSGIPNYERYFGRPLKYNYFESERKSHSKGTSSS